MIQSLRSIRYARMIRNYDLEREPDLKLVRNLLKAGDFVIDIGASIGLYSYHMAQWVGPTGLVYACEPMSATCDVLRRNMRRLRVDNIVINECAVSNADFLARMSIPAGRTHYESRIDPNGEYRVKPFTMDQLFARRYNPAFVKVDVEGHEPQLLNGAQDFLSGTNAAWLIEMDKTGLEVMAIMAKHGYKPFPTGTENCIFARRKP